MMMQLMNRIMKNMKKIMMIYVLFARSMSQQSNRTTQLNGFTVIFVTIGSMKNVVCENVCHTNFCNSCCVISQLDIIFISLL